MNKGNPDINSRERTKSHNDDDISIHASGDEIEDNANKKELGSNVSGAGGEHEPLSSYSSKVRSEDEEYSSHNSSDPTCSSLKGIEKKAKKEMSKETFSKLRKI